MLWKITRHYQIALRDRLCALVPWRWVNTRNISLVVRLNKITAQITHFGVGSLFFRVLVSSFFLSLILYSMLCFHRGPWRMIINWSELSCAEPFYTTTPHQFSLRSLHHPSAFREMEVKQKEKQKKNISCVLFEERYTHNNKHSTARRANTSFDQNASNQNINNTSGEKRGEGKAKRTWTRWSERFKEW